MEQRLNKLINKIGRLTDIHIIVMRLVHSVIYNMRIIVAALRNQQIKCQTIIFDKTMIETKEKYCPVCDSIMKLDSITLDGYKLYQCKKCDIYSELIPFYIDYFKVEVI